MKHSDATLFTQKSFKWVNTPITVLGVDITNDKSDLLKRNYEAVFKKVTNMANIWKNRNLSLAGKVITINTLMASQFIYKLSCMDSPTEEQYKEYKSITRNYLWDEKSSKIAYDTLTCSQEHGGFKLIDLKKKDSALKIQWIKRIAENKKLASLAYYFLPGLGPMLWKCNLNFKHAAKFMSVQNFWYDVLVSWCKYNFEELENIDSIMNSIIWLNSEITVKDKPLMSKKCIENDILYIKDLVNMHSGDFMSYNEFIQKYGNVINFLQYYGILKAIPQKYKDTIRMNAYDPYLSINTNYKTLLEKNLGSRFYYNKAIESEPLLEKFTTKWQNILGPNNVNENELSTSFKNIKVITLSTKLRSFYYTLLVQATITNVKPLKWNMVDTDKCTFCNVEIETVKHLFWDCPTAKHLWNQVTQWIKYTANQTVHLTDKKVFLCKIASKPLNCVNTIGLITLQYLYASRCLKRIPNFAQLKLKILDVQNIEKYIAIKNNRIKKHEIKWKGF